MKAFFPLQNATRIPFLTLLVALFVGLSACAPETETEEALEEEVIEDPALDTQPMAGEADLSSTIQALQGDITQMDPATAVSNIESWQQQLEASGDQSLQTIASGLGDLRDQLTQTPIDGATVGQTLTNLGDQTTQAAATAEVGVQEQLQQLGSLLSDAGAQLSGAGS